MHHLNRVALITMLLGANISLHAMDGNEAIQNEDITDSMHTDNNAHHNFTTIDTNALTRIINIKPPSAWRIGQLHSFYLLSPIYENDFDAETILGIPPSENFLNYAPPLKLTDFLNHRVPSVDHRLVTLSFDELLLEKLVRLIETSISEGKPLSFYSTNNDKLTILTVFGFRKGINMELLVLEGYSTDHNPHVISLCEFLVKIDLSVWISRLTSMISSMIKVGNIEGLPLAFNFLREIRRYTFIMYDLSFRKEQPRKEMPSTFHRYNECHLY